MNDPRKLESRIKIKKQKIARIKMKRYIKNKIPFIFICAVFVMLINTYAIQLIRVQGDSMSPTMEAGSHELLNKRAYIEERPQRFDVIFFGLLENSEHYYIKRIIGLPGESVRIEHGSIFINDNYLLDPISEVTGEVLVAKVDIQLGEDEYFVLGDNRENSLDSRDKNFGNVRGGRIIGKIIEW